MLSYTHFGPALALKVRGAPAAPWLSLVPALFLYLSFAPKVCSSQVKPEMVVQLGHQGR